MQCVFATSLGVLYGAIYFRTGNLWVTVFLHGGMDVLSMLMGGSTAPRRWPKASAATTSRCSSVLVYLIPAALPAAEKKIGEVRFYFKY